MIGWEIIATDLVRIRAALLKVLSTAESEKNTMSYYCAVEFKDLLFKNLTTQKYATGYAPYSFRYAQWKTERMLLGSSFWRLFGDLIQSLALHREKDGWFAGIPEGSYDTGGKSWFGTRKKKRGPKKPINMYAAVMEFGLNNHPARPMFLPTTEEYAASGWKEQGVKSLNRVGKAWI